MEEQIETLKKSPVNKRQILKEIETEFDIAQDSIEQMQMVAKSTFGGQSLETKVKKFRQQLATLQEEALKYGNAPNAQEQQRSKIMVGKDTIDKTGKRIDDSFRVALDSEETGGETLRVLVGDREKLQSTLEEMEVIDDTVNRSRNILNSMGTRIITNKIILSFIIVVLIVAILTIVYFKWVQPLLQYLDPYFNPPAEPAPIPVPVPAPFYVPQPNPAPF